MKIDGVDIKEAGKLMAPITDLIGWRLVLILRHMFDQHIKPLREENARLRTLLAENGIEISEKPEDK
jgi:CRISPR/Cas system endoribonuclease Cas6 (RAMP superfamily)